MSRTGTTFSCTTSSTTPTRTSIGRAYVGSSGFSYPSWRGGFYPRDARPGDFLRLYAARLPSVEVNATAYQLPAEGQLERWAREVPPRFRFAVRVPRRIADGGRLALLPSFCSRVRALGDALGPVLVVLERPRDDGFLRLFLDSLDPELAYAFDLRDASWDADALLFERGVARVGSLEGGARFRYLRLREPPYDDAALAGWAARLRPLVTEGIDVYCYFKHEDEPTAPRYAERLLDLLTTARAG